MKKCQKEYYMEKLDQLKKDNSIEGWQREEYGKLAIKGNELHRKQMEYVRGINRMEKEYKSLDKMTEEQRKEYKKLSEKAMTIEAELLEIDFQLQMIEAEALDIESDDADAHVQLLEGDDGETDISELWADMDE